MKRLHWIMFLVLALIGATAACGGGGAPAEVAIEEEPAAQTADEGAPEATEAPAEEAAPADSGEATTASSDEASPEEAAADAPDEALTVAGRPASGIDPDTNLEINPPTVVPGVDFIVRGEIVNANLTPQDSPEFVILAPTGTRYRIRAQDVSGITYEDGVAPALHEFQRGVLAQATVRQEEDAGATITVQSTDFTLLHSDQ